MLTIPLIFTGSALVIFGRKLYWFAIGLLGFLGGLLLVTRLFEGMSGATRILIAIGMGVVGAVFTVLVQKVALSVVGFIAGCYLALGALRLLQVDLGWISWVIVTLCGALGLFLVLRLFNWSLILLSSLAGAMIIVENVSLQGVFGLVALGGIFILGVLVQGTMHQRKKKSV